MIIPNSHALFPDLQTYDSSLTKALEQSDDYKVMTSSRAEESR
jgi:hypothetical protein